MEWMKRMYRGKQWADFEQHRVAYRLVRGLGLLLAFALAVLALAFLLGAADAKGSNPDERDDGGSALLEDVALYEVGGLPAKWQ